jgi:hypothetical protein
MGSRSTLRVQTSGPCFCALRPCLAGSTFLSEAEVRVLHDDPGMWPKELRLAGFAYNALAEQAPVSAKQRLAWLRRDPDGYSPQPYEQLTAVYRRAGRDQEARTVAIAKQRARRHTLGLPGRLWSLLLDGLVGYGYRTWLAAVWLAGFGWSAGSCSTAPTPTRRWCWPSRATSIPASTERSTRWIFCCPWSICTSKPSGSPVAGAVVGLGVDPSRLGSHHRGGGGPDRAAQTRLVARDVDQMWTTDAESVVAGKPTTL